MKTAFNRFVTTAVAASLLLPAVAGAQFTTYTTLASFLAATSNVGIDTYNDLTLVGAIDSPLNRTTTGSIYNYVATGVAATAGGNTSFYPAGTAADRWLALDRATTDIAYTGFAPTVRALGGFFFGSDRFGAFLPGQSIILTAVSAGGTQTFTLTNTTTTGFFGILASSAWTSLTVDSVQPTDGASWVAVNDFRVGQAAPVGVIPEPSTYALMATGLIGLAGFARRRRNL